ncbi:MAG: hypothetical protein ACRC7H_01645, partial [Plesiomonas shigelloides]
HLNGRFRKKYNTLPVVVMGSDVDSGVVVAPVIVAEDVEGSRLPISNMRKNFSHFKIRYQVTLFKYNVTIQLLVVKMGTKPIIWFAWNKVLLQFIKNSKWKIIQ